MQNKAMPGVARVGEDCRAAKRDFT